VTERTSAPKEQVDGKTPSSGPESSPQSKKRPFTPRSRTSERVILARINLYQTLGLSIIRCGFGALGCWFLYKAIGTLAGQNTSVTAMVNAIVDMRLAEWAGWGVAGVSTVGYARERQLRKRTIRGTGEHVEVLEKRIDPRRSTSGLTRDGTPPKPKKLRGKP
jgi:hypothetical protein